MLNVRLCFGVTTNYSTSNVGNVPEQETPISEASAKVSRHKHPHASYEILHLKAFGAIPELFWSPTGYSPPVPCSPAHPCTRARIQRRPRTHLRRRIASDTDCARR